MAERLTTPVLEEIRFHTMMKNTKPKHTLLTAAELSQRWRLPVNSIYTFARRREVPAIRLGDRV